MLAYRTAIYKLLKYQLRLDQVSDATHVPERAADKLTLDDARMTSRLLACPSELEAYPHVEHIPNLQYSPVRCGSEGRCSRKCRLPPVGGGCCGGSRSSFGAFSAQHLPLRDQQCASKRNSCMPPSPPHQPRVVGLRQVVHPECPGATVMVFLDFSAAAHAEMLGLRAACDQLPWRAGAMPAPRASCAGKPGSRQRRCSPRTSCRPAAFAACEQLQQLLVGCAWCAPIDATHEETFPVGLSRSVQRGDGTGFHAARVHVPQVFVSLQLSASTSVTRAVNVKASNRKTPTSSSGCSQECLAFEHTGKSSLQEIQRMRLTSWSKAPDLCYLTLDIFAPMDQDNNPYAQSHSSTSSGGASATICISTNGGLQDPL
eukprot:SM000122S25775  [mRNA]  locus=s122:211724:215986:+ [translate_table: standard]